MANVEDDRQNAWGMKYNYHEGDSEDDFIKRNAFGQRGTAYGAFNFMDPIGGMMRGIKGKQAYKKYRARYEAGQDAQDAGGRLYQVAKRDSQLHRMQGDEDTQRGRGLDALQAAYDDPTRSQAREDQYDAQVGNAYAGLGQEYDTGSRMDRLAAARRGIMGGSTDIEHQVKRSADLQSGLMGAVQQANTRRIDLNRSDLAQLYNLRRSLLSGDPGKADEYAALADRDSAQAERNGRFDDFLQARNRIKAEGYDNTSRLVGGIAQGAASGVESYYGRG